MDDVNNWLGRSPWGDPLFDGSIDEFRIYDTALSAAEVASVVHDWAPTRRPRPTLVIDRTTGAMTIANQSHRGDPAQGLHDRLGRRRAEPADLDVDRRRQHVRSRRHVDQADDDQSAAHRVGHRRHARRRQRLR